MVTSKSKAKPTLKPDAKADRKVMDASTSTKVANPYAISDQAAAQAVRRAGIVTAAGKLSRVYK